MTTSKPSKLKVAIVVDPAGTMTGPSAEEEIAEHKRVFTELLKPAEVSFQELHTFYQVRPGTDLVVYDYGGLMPGNDLMESNAREVVRWAQDNPTSLIVVVSAFTYRNFVQVDMEDNGLDLINIVCDDGKNDDPIPKWWREMMSLPDPDIEAVTDARYPDLEPEIKLQIKISSWSATDYAYLVNNKLGTVSQDGEYWEFETEENYNKFKQYLENGPEKEPEEEKPFEVIDKLPDPIGFITVPVYCDWRPKQNKGSMRFKLADSIVDVMEGDERIASVGGTFFGYYECSIPDGKGSTWQYSISPKDFWAQFEKLHAEFKEKDL